MSVRWELRPLDRLEGRGRSRLAPLIFAGGVVVF